MGRSTRVGACLAGHGSDADLSQCAPSAPGNGEPRSDGEFVRAQAPGNAERRTASIYRRRSQAQILGVAISAAY